MRVLSVTLVAGALILVGCGSDSDRALGLTGNESSPAQSPAPALDIVEDLPDSTNASESTPTPSTEPFVDPTQTPRTVKRGE